ncbi:Nuclear pore complex protein Nup153 [Anthophora retusa]
MAKGSNNLSGRRSSSHNTKPYDANNSFVKKVATKVTDLIPQRSWISKWFNSSQSEGDMLDDNENPEEVESEEDIQKPPPLKRPCIRMDVTHPPGTFSIKPRTKPTINRASSSKQQYSLHNEMSEDCSKPAMAGPSGISHLVSSTPTLQSNIRNTASQRSELNSLVTTTNNGTTNGMDDNSESSESTSGCSSLIPQTNRQEAPSNVSYNSSFSNRKRFNNDKLSFTNHMQSPRSLFLDNHNRDSLSSRRPSFNASIMINTSDRASPLASPFYSGNITFGGANAAGLYKRGRNLFNSSNEIQLKIPKRTSVEVKPSNTAGVDSSGMSQTAKKILEALEHFSSPITDAKKIPLKTMNNTPTNKKRTREEATMSTTKVGLRHLTRELTVPTVPDILKLRRRQKLQDTTAAARKIISARSDPPPPQEYQIRTQTDNDVKHQGKVKTKTANLEQEETVEPVNLPNIPLPISSLPNFNFMSPSNLKVADSTNTAKEESFTFASPIKVTNIAKNLKSINNFTFSSPINADKQAANKHAIDKSNDSDSPLKKIAAKSNTPFSDCVPSVTQNFIWSGSSTAPRPKEKVKNGDNTAPTISNELKSGSVMDILGSKSTTIEPEKSSETKAQLHLQKESVNDKTDTVVQDITKDDNITKSSNSKSNIQDTSNMWECSECLFKINNSETQCFACKTAKPNLKNKKTSELLVSSNVSESKTTVNDNFGSQFKLSSNQWECVCLVRNKLTDSKCVVCSAFKPDTKQETNSNALNSANSDLNSVKSLEKSSECSNTCSLNASKTNSLKINSQKDVNVAENTSTNQITSMSVDTSLNNANPIKDETMDKFKLSKDMWECPSCMVRNVASVDSCPCCNTAKPSVGVTTKNDKTPSLLANGFGDKFKKPEGAWNCDICMVQNEAKITECVACGGLKPGAKKLNNSSSTSTGSSLQFSFGIPVNSGGFKFGIDKADQGKTENTASTKGFKFGDSQQSNQVGQFTFGIQKEEKKTSSETLKPENNVTPTSGSGFGFQINTNNSEKTDVKQDSEKAEKKPALAFSFGIPKSESGTVEADKQPINVTSTTLPSFTFGVPTPKIVQSDTKEEKQDSLPGNTVTEISKPSTQTTESPAASNINVLPSITQSSSQEAKQTNTFSFGVLSNPIAIATSTATNVVSSLPSSTQSSFIFLKPKSTSQTAPTLPTFGQIPATTSTLSNTFKFEENKTTEGSSMPKTFDTLIPNSSSRIPLFSGVDAPPLFSNSDAKTASTFGQTTTTEENKQPVFGASTSKPATFALPDNKVPAFGGTENKPSIFGSPDTKIPVFGSTDNKTTSLFNSTPQAPTPFGAPSTTLPTLFGATAVFGNNTTSTFTTKSTPSIFGSTSKPNETSTQSSNLFTFGTTTQPVAQPGTGFNFSATTNPAEPTPKPLFTFGSNSTTPQSGNLFGNTFNNPTPANSSGFTFNAPKPETPAFGQPTAASPIFGASQSGTQNQPSSSFSSTPANTGFNFGSTAPATSLGGFNFGAVASASAPSTGFTFNPPSTTPTFDPNTRPSYNFTGGNAPKTFNATPVPRKIKKAFRRIR